MTFTQIVKDIFKRKPKDAVDNSSNGGVKRFLSKISGAFMLPVSVMAIAGLFLGVGAAISANTSATTLGLFIKNLGDPVFAAIPALFMIAIIISFTDDKGTAVFSGIIAFLVFNSLQIPFIQVEGDNQTGTAFFLGIDMGEDIAQRLYKTVGFNLGISSLNTSIFGGIVVGFIVAWAYNRFQGVQLPSIISFFGGKRFVPLVSIILMMPIVFIFLLIYPFIGLGFAYFGEFSGKAPGGIDSFAFGYIERALIPFGLHHVFYAPLWWTTAGGDVSGSLADWAKVPTNQITSINGGAITLDTENLRNLKDLVVELNNSDYFDWTGFASPGITITNGQAVVDAGIANTDVTNALSAISVQASNLLVSNVTDEAFVKDISQYVSSREVTGGLASVLQERIGLAQGDSTGWIAVNGSSVIDVTYNTDKVSGKTLKIFAFVADELGVKLGRFLQGKYAFMQFGLPAAGLAMIMAAPKENRKAAAAVVIPASMTSFVTGVTEPIEFTFVFLAPVLFWGFHAVMAGLSFLLMNVLGAHVGVTFSGGIIDTIIYGVIPIQQGTNFYWMYVIGLGLAPIYFFVFYWWIKKFNLDTPGRGGNTKLFTKADFKASKEASKAGGITAQGAAIVKAAGGWDNITKFSNCATRLRWDVKDSDKVDVDAAKAAGAMGVSKISKTHVQIIVGPVAEQLNGNVKTHVGADLGQNNDSATKSDLDAPKASEEMKEGTKKMIEVKSVTDGSVKTLASLKDGVFSEKMMGDGVVVASPKTSKEAEFFAPVSGELVTVFPTGHAYGLRTDEGVEILLHIGLDTVNLNGKGFTPAVKQGDKVKVGDKLATVDLDYVRKNAPSADAIIIVTSGQSIKSKATGKVTKSSKLFEV